MHFSNFENLNLQPGDEIFFTDSNGKGYYGVYRGGYTRSNLSFNFLNFNGSQIEEVSLSEIQVLQKKINV